MDGPDLIARLDQAMAEMGPLAKVLRAHFDAMLAVGFSEEQAFALTMSVQHAVFTGPPA